MIQKLASRKLLALVVTALLVALGGELGIGDREMQSVVTVAGGFILGQSIEDFAAPIRSLKERLLSRKFLVYAGLTVLSAVSGEIGINPVLLDTLSTYFVGQGVADFGRWRRAIGAPPG